MTAIPTVADVRAMLRQMRHAQADLETVEAKRAGGGVPKNLHTSVSAFANSRGGVILLGVDEASGFTVTGVRNPAAAQAEIQDMMAQMEPPIRGGVEILQVDGQPIITVAVSETPRSLRPCYYKPNGIKSAHVRTGDADHPLTDLEIQRMLIERGQPRWDEEPVPQASYDDLDPDLVAPLLTRRRTRSTRDAGLSDDEILRNLKILVRHDGAWVPSVAALLAVGMKPQSFFARLGGTLVVYPNSNAAVPGPGGERFIDNVRLEGSIPYMLLDALKALRRNMTMRRIVTGTSGVDVWEYPDTALREAIINAFAHRDLGPGARGAPVQIEKYPDRLVIRNPGPLFGTVRVEDLGLTTVSSARNATLMRILEDVVGPPGVEIVCENRGTGMGAMILDLRRAGLTPPQFQSGSSAFTATFPNHTLLDPETLQWIRDRGHAGIAQEMAMAIAALRQAQVLTNASYRKLTGVTDSRLATQQLQHLVDIGIAARDGSRRAAKYRLAEDEDEDVVVGMPVGPRDRRVEIETFLRSHPQSQRVDIENATGLATKATQYWLRVLSREGRVRLIGTERSRSSRYEVISRDPDQ